MLNLFIAVILEGFSDVSEDDALLTEYEYTIFQEEWKKFDPEATRFIPANRISEFLHSIYDRFPILMKYMTKDEFHNKIYSLTLPIFHMKCVEFSDVMKETTNIVVECHARSINEDMVSDKIKSFYEDEELRNMATLSKKEKMRGTNNEDWSLITYFAAQKVQTQFQRYRNRKRFLEQNDQVEEIEEKIG